MYNVLKVPKILLPKNVDMTKWSCVACDQFTSEPEYWQKLEEFVGNSPSTLKLIYPEVYLKNSDDKRVDAINNTMSAYYNDGLFEEVESLILVKRVLNSGEVRLGLMLAVDLEAYEYTPENKALIKATEKTVVERLPARINVRKNATLELPHVMLLVDDPDMSIIEPLYSESEEYEILYDFKLNMDGGWIIGYRVPNSESVLEKIYALLDSDLIFSRYGVKDNKILFAVGDGNHSLATAKECWELTKKDLSDEEKATHSARFALCELVNLYDESLKFEPIHRIIFNANDDFIVNMALNLSGEGRIKVVFKDEEYLINVPINPSEAIRDIQDFIDAYIEEHNEVEQDYIHGDSNLSAIAKRDNAIAIYMPTLAKEGLFKYCLERGVLPRKSFSMGVAEDKRYYLESRKIK